MDQPSVKDPQIMRQGLFFIALLGSLLIGQMAAHADRGRGRHGQLYVVPMPGEVVIDANLDDWDLSGQIEMFVEQATRSTQNAKLAAMYDDEALYLAGEVRDPTPMMNRHDPAVRPHRAWDADSCQFRIVVDPDAKFPETQSKYGGTDQSRTDIVHLLMWHYTDEGTSHLQMSQSMAYNAPREEWEPHGLVPQDKFEGSYRRWDNGRGYTFEYRIPWETMGAENPPSGGDMVAGTANLFWSAPDGLSTGGGRSWAYDIMREAGFPFQAAQCWGRLFFTEQGNVPEELVFEGVPSSRELPLEFEYELPADGEATVQIMGEDGIVRRIIVAQEERPGGLNVERWDGMDNHALVPDHGDFIQPGEYRRMGTFNKENLRAQYRFSVHNSGDPPYMTDDGTGGWGGDHGTPQDVAALDDGLLLSWSAAEHGFPIIKVDLDGNKVWGSSGRGIHARFLATDGERVFFNSGPNVEMLDVDDSRPTSLPDGPGRITPPSGGEGQSRISGIAYSDGIIYVSYEPRNMVALFDGDDGSVVETWEVEKPGRMAALPDGAMAVISTDAVVRVSDGEVSPWLSDNLDEPVGITVGDAGNVYVANRGDLQNVSVFDGDGHYLRSLGREGGRPAMGAYDPSGMYMPGGIAMGETGELWVAETTDGPKRISVWDVDSGENIDEFFGASAYFAHGHIDPANPDEIYAHNVLWEIDWDNYETTPRTTIWRRTEAGMAPAPNVSAHGGGFTMMTTDNGVQFGWGRSGGMFIYMRDGDLFRPIAGDAGRGQFWSDQDEDGFIDPDEVHERGGLGALLQIDKDLNLWFSCGRRLEPSQVVDGQPMYDPADAVDTPLRGEFSGWRSHYGWNMLDNDGNAYSSHVTGQGSTGPGLTMKSPDGELVWQYPDMVAWRDAINLPTGAPGRLWGATQLLGVGGDYVALQTYVGVTHIFRRDGMYIGAVLGGGPRGEYDPELGDARYDGQPEGQGGSFVKLNIDGEDRYFIIHGGHNVRVWELLGLDTMRDLPAGTYVHTEEDLQIARETYEQYLAELEGIQNIVIAGGGRAGLEDAEPVGRRSEGNRGFEARLAYDADNLYVHYEVESDHGLINSQADPQIVFRGGNLIDIQLAADPGADPEREEPAPGDLRLLVTRQNGRKHAVLFRPRVDGFDGERIVLKSPTGEEPFDSIEVVDWVGLDYEETDLGFEATVTVPLEKLGLELTSGQELRMDLGYVFGNSGGTKARRRLYLNTSSFSANVVDDIPNESRLEPDEWGTATVE